MTINNSNALEWLLSPVTSDTFEDQYWEQRSLRIQRGDCTYYRALLDESALDFALYSAARAEGGIEVFGTEGRSHFARNQLHAIEAVRAGRSIRIFSIQRFVPAVVRLKVMLEKYFSCPLNVNMYLTPSNGKALPMHYDTHDVFVLQIAGKKRWRLYDDPVRGPLEYLPMLRGESRRDQKLHRLEKREAHTDATIEDEFVHQSGDLLYLPRGTWHEAFGDSDTTSCHLTFGIQVVTYAELFSVAIGTCAKQNQALRRALPLGYATGKDTRAVVKQTLDGLYNDLNFKPDALDALSTVAHMFIRTRRSITESGLYSGQEAMATSHECEYSISPYIVCGVDVRAAHVYLLWHEHSEAFEFQFEPACRYIAAAGRITEASLPGSLSEDEKKAFIARLVEAGLLAVHLPAHRENFADDSRDGSATATVVETPHVNALIDSPQHIPADLIGYMPVRFNETRSKLFWIRAGGDDLRDPFYAESVQRLRDNGAAHIVTGVEALATLTTTTVPSGFIFHISRCGSTLIANALRALGTSTVVSEARVISQAFSNRPAAQSESFTVMDRARLVGVINAFLPRDQDNRKRLVIKFTSWNILWLKLFREIWPEVPYLIVIRDTAEVVASCLDHPTGWFRLKEKSRRAARLVGRPESQIDRMTPEEYCAVVLEAFMAQALVDLSPKCKVLDYRQINSGAIRSAAKHFDINLDPTCDSAVEDVLARYSKDPAQKAVYQGDSEEKKAAAARLRESPVFNSVTRLYQQLLALSM